MCNAHLNPETSLEPGLYATDPQGHTLIVGQTTSWGEVRSISIANLGGVIQIAGIDVTDPDILDQLGDRLHANAASLRHEQTHPYRPDLPGVQGCNVCGHRTA